MLFFHWNTSPELISFGNISIGWYGVFFAAGFVLGFHIMSWVFEREAKSLKTIDHLFIYMVLGAVLGARLGHILFYNPEYYFSNPLEIFKIYRGGLASHGGTVGMLIAMYLYARKTTGISYFWLLDRMTIPIALGSFFIRLGNLFNSEIIGLPTNLPWAVVFDRFDNLPRHPAQLYEAVVYLALFITLLVLYRKHKTNLKPGFMMGLLMVWIFSSRFIIEFVKIPQEHYAPIMNLNTGQWLSLPFVLIGIYLLYRSRKHVQPKFKNVIFDLGAVMFKWNPPAIVKNFTEDEELQQRILSDFYFHQNWMDFDCGHITEQQAIKRASESLQIDEADATRLLEQTKESLVLIEKTRDLLQEVKNRQLNAYCLSNISPELFEYLSHRHDLFEQFDGIVTSGVENVAKPGKRIFEILLNRYNLDPKQCLFIDDSEANTATAEGLGITSIRFTASEQDYEQIYASIN